MPGMSLEDLLMRYCSLNAGRNTTRLECMRRTLHPHHVLASEQFAAWHIASGSVDDPPKSPLYEYQLGFSLALAWAIASVGVWKGVESMGKIVYFTVGYPFIVAFVLVVSASTLEGAMEGMAWFLRPSWCGVSSMGVWTAAASQAYASNFLASGPIVTLASYNGFHNDAILDSLIISTADFVFSVVAGLGIFGVAGHVAHMTGTTVSELMLNQVMLPFSVILEYSASVGSVSPSSPWLRVREGEVGRRGPRLLLLPHVRPPGHRHPVRPHRDHHDVHLRRVARHPQVQGRHRPLFPPPLPLPVAEGWGAGLSLGLAVPSLGFMTRSGMNVLEVVDTAIYAFLPTTSIVIFVIVFYGYRHFLEDIRMMMGSVRGVPKTLGNFVFTSFLRWFPSCQGGGGVEWDTRWMMGAWYLVPLGLTAISALVLINFGGRYASKKSNRSIIYDFMAMAIPGVLLLLGALRAVCVRKKGESLLHPSPLWGPEKNKHRQGVPRYPPLGDDSAIASEDLNEPTAQSNFEASKHSQAAHSHPTTKDDCVPELDVLPRGPSVRSRSAKTQSRSEQKVKQLSRRISEHLAAPSHPSKEAVKESSGKEDVTGPNSGASGSGEPKAPSPIVQDEATAKTSNVQVV